MFLMIISMLFLATINCQGSEGQMHEPEPKTPDTIPTQRSYDLDSDEQSRYNLGFDKSALHPKTSAALSRQPSTVADNLLVDSSSTQPASPKNQGVNLDLDDAVLKSKAQERYSDKFLSGLRARKYIARANDLPANLKEVFLYPDNIKKLSLPDITRLQKRLTDQITKEQKLSGGLLYYGDKSGTFIQDLQKLQTQLQLAQEPLERQANEQTLTKKANKAPVNNLLKNNAPVTHSEPVLSAQAKDIAAAKERIAELKEIWRRSDYDGQERLKPELTQALSTLRKLEAQQDETEE